MKFKNIQDGNTIRSYCASCGKEADGFILFSVSYCCCSTCKTSECFEASGDTGRLWQYEMNYQSKIKSINIAFECNAISSEERDGMIQELTLVSSNG